MEEKHGRTAARSWRVSTSELRWWMKRQSTLSREAAQFFGQRTAERHGFKNSLCRAPYCAALPAPRLITVLRSAVLGSYFVADPRRSPPPLLLRLPLRPNRLLPQLLQKPSLSPP